MGTLFKFIESQWGYARMADMEAAGFHAREIARTLSEEVIDKAKPGLYKLVAYKWGSGVRLLMSATQTKRPSSVFNEA